MVHKPLELKTNAAQTRLVQALDSVVSALELPGDYPPQALAEARTAIDSLVLPDHDLTEIEFVTIDPAASTDLDQAVHLARDGEGYVVRYAIADVPALVELGGALDAETRHRGQTLYLPGHRVPLHPEIISEDAGSLLPGQRRGAYVWTFHLDAAALVRRTGLLRATVCSRQKLDYAGVQASIDEGHASESLALLKEVGLKRIEAERERGGASLRIPEQEVEVDEDGVPCLTVRAALPVEDWNAQISLLTGMEAARIMLEGGIGILRTMPAPDEHGSTAFRRQAASLGTPWRDGVPYGEFLRSLDVTEPRQLAIMHAATSLFRGAGYTAFDGEAPEERIQAAIAAPYAHTTAPLRRLVDRFSLVVCEHLVRGAEVPAGIRRALVLLPELMQSSNQVAGTAERAAIDTVEAALLSDRIGEKFDAITLNGTTAEQAARARENGEAPGGRLQLLDPAVNARFLGRAEAGERVQAELIEADIDRRTVLFRID
ncbi:MAG: RNB domain-containing ribonuclease [Arthrobacter sp.]|uniref:RNB domain-containing ribonuclease n=1 Tax=unclassified Arthrobacter TaxID=235627 RepID=UPI00264D1D6B|nr:RNB domain-containing ribonuclease [Micrococcaceae bacterium]MDN5812621.1 RNB domain-containing ribonuclease [Micrococcaceae bacterium]MDN5824264.1 RNB domain-containing ribonuclease [Micrococcaceae bacterium]MDN5880419.1 RNB domain-containing ribonuclease [Micrococcaceae bacterium]MDN5887210.1 RNB domain-containing ribonuclease [Micrococcaceae bacterium]